MTLSPFRKLLLDRAAAAFRSREDLRGYQSGELIPFMKAHPFSGEYVDMGLGKTVSVLSVLADLFAEAAIRHALIIAPLRVAVQTWPTEIREWSHTWWMSYTLIRPDERHPELLAACRDARKTAREDPLGSPNWAAGKAKTAHLELQRKRLARRRSMIHIINREAVEWLVGFWGKYWPYDCVIVDESTSFSDHRTKRWKALNSVRGKITRMHLLSGIPAPEGIEDYFAQVYLLDRGARFGRSITKFRETYLDVNRYTHEKKPKEGAERDVAAKIAGLCIVMREEDYLPRQKAIIIERPIILDPEELKQYRRFERDSIIDLDDEEIEAESGAALAQKLLQAASGAVYDANGQWHRLHDHKLEELAELRDEAQGSPLLVAYWHRASRDRLKHAFPKAVLMDGEGRRVPDWNAGKIDMLLVHPRSAGHGLNMQYGPGHTLVYFDNPSPLEDWAQTIKRLDRPGQKKTVRVYHLIAKGTVDEALVPRVRGKDFRQDAIKQYIRDLRKGWTGSNFRL